MGKDLINKIDKCVLEKINKELSYTFIDKQQSFNDFNELMLARTINFFEHDFSENEMMPYEIFEKWLILNGYVVIVKLEDKDIKINKNKYRPGLYMFSYEASLVNKPSVLHTFTNVIVNSPALGLSKEYEIGKDCVLIKNTITMLKFDTIFSKNSKLLANSEQTMYMVNILTRAQAMVKASNQTLKEGAIDFFESIERGNIGVVIDDELVDKITSTPLYSTNTNYMSQLIEYHQYLKANYLQDLTLNANYNMKRESLTNSEVLLNDDALKSLRKEMLRGRKKGIAEVNKMFNVNYKIWEEEENENKSNDK